MNELIIAIKNKTNIITALEEFYEIKFDKKQTLFEKLLLKQKRYPDIYFHQGSLNTKALDMIEHSKLTIINSRTLKEEVLEKRSYINEDKIEILYPYIATKREYSKEIKKEFKELHTIPKDTRIIFFSSKDIEQGGIEKFLEIVQNLENRNFVLLFDIPAGEEIKLEDKLKKYNLADLRIVLQNQYTQDELFMISDIYILPTKQKLFVPNLVKAMYFKNAVFVTRENVSSEIIDSFSLILGQDDRNIYFKVDALLDNKKELKTIQKENYLVVKNMTFENYLKELRELINFHFLEEGAGTREF